jgi:hypothetical protein
MGRHVFVTFSTNSTQDKDSIAENEFNNQLHAPTQDGKNVLITTEPNLPTELKELKSGSSAPTAEMFRTKELSQLLQSRLMMIIADMILHSSFGIMKWN